MFERREESLYCIADAAKHCVLHEIHREGLLENSSVWLIRYQTMNLPRESPIHFAGCFLLSGDAGTSMKGIFTMELR